MKKFLLSLACVLTLGALSASAVTTIFESFGNNGASINDTSHWDTKFPTAYGTSATTHKSLTTGIEYEVNTAMYTQESNKYFLQFKKAETAYISFAIPENCESITLTNGQGGATAPKAKISIGSGDAVAFTFNTSNKFTYTLPENYEAGAKIKIATNGGALRIAALTYNIAEGGNTDPELVPYTGFPEQMDVPVGESISIAAGELPEHVEFIYDDCVSVSEDGIVTGLHQGEGMIYASWIADSKYEAGEATINVTVTAKEKGVYSKFPTELTLTEGDTKALADILTPKSIIYVSSNEDVVAVTDEGVVTALAAGTANIDIVWDEDEDYVAGEATIAVTVNKAPEGIVYELVKSAADLNTTDTYILVTYGAYNNNYYGIYTEVGGVQSDAIAGQKIAEYSALNPSQPESFTLASDHKFHEYQIQENGEYKALYDVTAGKYIGGSAKVALSQSATLSATDSYRLTFADADGGGIKISCQAATSRQLAFAKGSKNDGTGDVVIKNYATSNVLNYVAIYKKVVKAEDPEPEVLDFVHTIYNVNYGVEFSAGGTAGTKHFDESKSDDFVYEIRHSHENTTVYVKLDVKPADVAAGDDPSTNQPGIMAVEEGFSALEGQITVPQMHVGTLQYYAEQADENGKVTAKSPIYTLNFAADTSAVDAIEVDDNAKAEYFNLQGVKVAQPTSGLYIVRRGNTVTKEIVK